VKEKKLIPIKNSIASRLLKIVFSAYLIIAAFVTVGHMFMEYQYQKNITIQDLENVQRSFEQVLAIDMWQMNQKSLVLTIQGILEINDVVGIKVKNSNDNFIAAAGIVRNDDLSGNVGQHINMLGIKPEDFEIDKNEVYNFDVFEHSFPILYEFENTNRQLGTAQIYSNSSVVYRRVKLGFLLLILNAFIKILALGLVFFKSANLLIRKPLTSLAESTDKINLKNLETFRVKIVTKGRNELAVLVESFNSMIEKLHTSISERDRAQEELTNSEKRLRTIIDTVPSLIFVKNAEGRFIIINKAVSESIGLAPDDIIQKLDSEIHSDSDEVQKMLEYDRDVLKSGQTLYISEENFIDKKGSQRWMQTIKVPCKDDVFGEPVIVGIALDITDRKLQELELQRLQKYLSNIIDSMPSILVGVDSKGIINQWNLEAERITGKKSEEINGRALAEAIPRLSTETTNINNAIRTGTEYHESKRVYIENDVMHYEDITIYPLIAKGIEGAVLRIDDVTEKVHLEELMIQSEKMLSVGGLAAGMAHEINNPLAGMIQTSAVLKNRLGKKLGMPANIKAAEEAGTTIEAIELFMENREIGKMLDSIMESGKRVSLIVQNMLSFSRKSEGINSEYSIEDIINKTLELVVSDYDMKKKYDFKTIKIEKEYEKGTPPVKCKEGEIQQVILNILRNGAQAMHQQDNSNPRFLIRTYYDDMKKMNTIEIQDNGPGMTREIKKRIFEPFFTTKPAGFGTGLGLSVSYFIITENHKGEMSVDSALGKGSKFTIKLPV